MPELAGFDIHGFPAFLQDRNGARTACQIRSKGLIRAIFNGIWMHPVGSADRMTFGALPRDYIYVVDRANIGTHFFCTLFFIQKRSRFNSFARIDLNQKDILKSSQVAPSGIRS
jgi:hypothetical protein